MKLHKSGGFVLAAILTLVVVWGAMWLYPRIMLAGYNPAPIVPGDINLIAVQKGARYKIIVSNGIAHLLEIADASGGEAGFDAPVSDWENADTQDTGRLPIRETLQSLQGDAVALGKLVMSVNKIKEEDLPSVRVVWKAEDLTKAVSGDKALQDKLEHDLNTRLDGTPLAQIDRNAILNGIVVDSPVTVNVPIKGNLTPVVCRIQEPYKTLFAGAIENIIVHKFTISNESLIGYYKAEAAKILGPRGHKEDVRASILSKIDPKTLGEKAVGPERILANTKVLISESEMTGASFVQYQGQNRAILSDITLRLTEDGKKRLWKYSHDNPGFQLLFTENGVAIAAPRIKTELAENEVKLTRVASKELVEDAVNAINLKATGSKQK